ncbi:hypothetical protein GQ42DRAFT_144665 [Ramicandelaber brevisporus]|nr:hypothetical protein GQ42DRAFT_144665 [Ramicandelaber brevisporus]
MYGSTLPHPAADWQVLNDQFYRRERLYEMQWTTLGNDDANVDLTALRVVGAPQGGPIAVMRDPSKLNRQQYGRTELISLAQTTLDLSIYVFSAAGKPLRKIENPNAATTSVVGFGWTDREELVMVYSDAAVRIYRIDSSFSLGLEASEHGVIDARVWGNGLVALTGNMKFIAVNNLLEPRPRILADPQLTMEDFNGCWTVAPVHLARNRHVEVLVCKQNTVFVIDARSCTDQLLHQHGPFNKMALSPDGSHIALFNHISAKVLVVTADFQQSLAVVDVSPISASGGADAQLVWCGNDAVVLNVSHPSEVLQSLTVVALYGDSIKIHLDETVCLISDHGCIRVVSNNYCDLLQRVPDSISQVFAIGSTAPAAILYDALDRFERRSARAEENIRSIRDELASAVTTCITAAGEEHNIATQKALLRAASFGKSFLDVYDSDRLVEMCRTLRVVNALREPSVGIPLTASMYQSQSPDIWLGRLTARGHHLLAMRICEYLGFRPDRVLIDWACATIYASPNVDDDTLYRTLMARLRNYRGLSFAEIVATATSVTGSRRLAARLLDHEPRAADQVPLLMNIGEDARALGKAIESGDDDLVYYVILMAYRAMSLGEFYKLISGQPLACNLFEQFIRSSSPSDDTNGGRDMLRNFYYQDDRRVDVAYLALEAGTDAEILGAKLASVSKMFAEDPSSQFESAAIATQKRLVEFQARLDREVGHPATISTASSASTSVSSASSSSSSSFLGLTLTETLYKCVLLGMFGRAAELQSEFSIPIKRQWWITLRALAERRDWGEIERLAKSRPKSPIGYLPFVEQCLAAHSAKEAAKYIPKCDAGIRPGLYLSAQMYKEAGQAAFENRDAEVLKQIIAKTKTPAIAGDLTALLNQLTKK